MERKKTTNGSIVLKRKEHRPMTIPDLDDLPRQQTVITSMQFVRAMIHENRELTVQYIPEGVGISIGSCHAILTEKLNIHRGSLKFVSRLLTDDQKENRVNISQELLD